MDSGCFWFSSIVVILVVAVQTVVIKQSIIYLVLTYLCIYLTRPMGRRAQKTIYRNINIENFNIINTN
jgi:hypothetical protein